MISTLQKTVLGIVVSVLPVFAGCATSRPVTVKSPESVDQQIEAARKVVGALGQTDLDRKGLERVARDVQKDPEAQDAARKILGTAPMRAKYSPATGKHYSGSLDVDPETGVKLEWLPE